MRDRKPYRQPVDPYPNDLADLCSGDDRRVQAIMIARGLAPDMKQRVRLIGVAEKPFFLLTMTDAAGEIAVRRGGVFIPAMTRDEASTKIANSKISHLPSDADA